MKLSYHVFEKILLFLVCIYSSGGAICLAMHLNNQIAYIGFGALIFLVLVGLSWYILRFDNKYNKIKKYYTFMYATQKFSLKEVADEFCEDISIVERNIQNAIDKNILKNAYLSKKEKKLYEVKGNKELTNINLQKNLNIKNKGEVSGNSINCKGITLIALVITIVVLIILAAVSINLTIGENGLITRTKQATFESKKSEYREKLSLAIIDEKLDRTDKEKEETFIRSLADRIQSLDFVKENGITLLKDDTELQSGDNKALANKLEVETKEGYVFIIEVDNNTLEANILDEVIKEVTNYTITYKANISGGSQADIVESVRAGRSTKTKLANAFTRTGYALIGWSDNSSSTTGEYAVGDSIGQVTNNITLYAVWGEDIVYLSFDSNGGDNTMEDQPVQKGIETSITLNNISREGYTFDSWNTTTNGSGTSYADNAQITITENTTLYAQWKDATGPEITSMTGTLGSITVAAADAQTGVTGYAITTSNSAPSNYTNWNGSSTIINVSNNTDTWLWVKNGDDVTTTRKFKIHEHTGSSAGGGCYGDAQKHSHTGSEASGGGCYGGYKTNLDTATSTTTNKTLYKHSVYRAKLLAKSNFTTCSVGGTSINVMAFILELYNSSGNYVCTRQTWGNTSGDTQSVYNSFVIGNTYTNVETWTDSTSTENGAFGSYSTSATVTGLKVYSNYYALNCGKNTNSVDYWNRNCGYNDGQLIIY